MQICDSNKYLLIRSNGPEGAVELIVKFMLSIDKYRNLIISSANNNYIITSLLKMKRENDNTDNLIKDLLKRSGVNTNNN